MKVFKACDRESTGSDNLWPLPEEDKKTLKQVAPWGEARR